LITYEKMSSILARSGLLAIGAAGGFYLVNSNSISLSYDSNKKESVPAFKSGHVPSRQEQLDRLSKATPDNPYDILIIGGGATGTGCALDAITR
jgi:glycerol-3-phosphate dehydrogenase